MVKIHPTITTYYVHKTMQNVKVPQAGNMFSENKSHAPITFSHGAKYYVQLLIPKTAQVHTHVPFCCGEKAPAATTFSHGAKYDLKLPTQNRVSFVRGKQRLRQLASATGPNHT